LPGYYYLEQYYRGHIGSWGKDTKFV